MYCNGTRKLTLIRVFFLYSETPKWESPWEIERKIERRQIELDLVITHQGQCPHQVSLNLADPHFQGLTRFLSQGLLKTTKKCLHSHFFLWTSLHVQRGRLMSSPINTSLVDLPFLALTVYAPATVDEGMACSDELSSAFLMSRQWSIKGWGRSCRYWGMSELYWRHPEKKKRVFESTYLETISEKKNWKSTYQHMMISTQVVILIHVANTCEYIHRHNRFYVSSPHLCATSPITETFLCLIPYKKW